MLDSQDTREISFIGNLYEVKTSIAVFDSSGGYLGYLNQRDTFMVVREDISITVEGIQEACAEIESEALSGFIRQRNLEDTMKAKLLNRI